MELFLNDDFFRWFSVYFTKETKLCYGTSGFSEYSAFSKELDARLLSFSKDRSVEKITELLEYIASSDWVNKTRYDGYLELRSELFAFTDGDIYNMYAIMFSVADLQIIPFPAYDVLFDRFHELAQYVVRQTFAPVKLKTQPDAAVFEKEFYRALALYVLFYCPTKAVRIWGENYDGGTPEPEETGDGEEEDSPYEEYERLNCYVEITDAETVDRIRKADRLPAFFTTDLEYGNMLICNLITFATKDLSDAVTVQITAHQHFSSYEEMFGSLGSWMPWSEDGDPASNAERMRKLFPDCVLDSPMCLYIRELAIPILKLADLERLRRESIRCAYRIKNADYLDYSDRDTFLTLDCCGIEVGNWYRYCPKCGKRVDLTACKKGMTTPHLGLYELFDYATWNCLSCGRGFERFGYRYCPMCGERRRDDDDTLEFDKIEPEDK